MTIKRSPAIKPEHRAKYEKISKADLVEAFRDFARDIGGFGEADESLWFAELERRVEIVRNERKAGNPMLHDAPTSNEWPILLYGGDGLIHCTKNGQSYCGAVIHKEQLPHTSSLPTCLHCAMVAHGDGQLGTQPRNEKRTLFPDVEFGDLPKSPCSGTNGYGTLVCPVCGKCRTESFFSTGEKPPRPIGEVIHSTSWHVYFCATCEKIFLDPAKWEYIGDGESVPRATDGRKEVRMSYSEWNSYQHWGLEIAKLFTVRRPDADGGEA